MLLFLLVGTHHERPCDLTQSFESIEIDDIFTKLMGFFVTPSAIDVDSVSSILYVSKAWNILSTRPARWTMSQQAFIIPQNNLTQNPLQLISDRLIGYRNLGRTSATQGRSFFVSERGTGRTYNLKIQRLDSLRDEKKESDGQEFNRNGSDETRPLINHSEGDDCAVIPSSIFREIRATEKLSAHRELFNDQDGDCCNVSTLEQWDVVDGHLLRWYNHMASSMTLSNFIYEKSPLSSGALYS